MKRQSIKQKLNWFHLSSSLANERRILFNLLAASYMPKRAKTEVLRGNLQISEARLWPTGYILDK